MGIHFVLQVLSIGLILWVFKNDERFETKGSHLGMWFSPGNGFLLSILVTDEDGYVDQSFDFGVASAVISGLMVILLTFTALSARAGQQWAAGKSARQARRHRRTRSGRVVAVPEGVEVPEEQAVTIAEVEQALDHVDETTGLLAGNESQAAGGGHVRATDNNV